METTSEGLFRVWTSACTCSVSAWERPAARHPTGCPRAVSARVRGGGEAGFQMFFSDFVRQLTWLSPRECLYGSRHLGRAVIAAAEPAVPCPIRPCGIAREPTRRERGLCRRHFSRPRRILHSGRPGAGRPLAFPRPRAASPGEPRLLHAPPGPPAPAPRVPPPRPRWGDSSKQQAHKRARPRPRPGLRPGSPSRANATAPDGRGWRAAAGPGAPRRAHLPAPLSPRRLRASPGSSGLLDCHRPWVVATGGNSACQI